MNAEPQPGLTTDAPTVPNSLGWMLDEALQVPGTRFAVLFSGDGLRLAHSASIGRDEADRFSAGMGGAQSLFRNAAMWAGSTREGWRQVLSEYENGFLLLAAAGENSYLGFSVTHEADLETVAIRMRELVQRLGRELSVATRGGDAPA